ncbi:MAG: hypothetical protein ACR2ID_04935 [Chthoniobacterales bacterium]
MRRVLLFVGLLVSFASIALAADAPKGARPQFRPALLGSGPTSLINRIDGVALMKAGQKDGAVMFSAMASIDGALMEPHTYRAMPESKALEEEVSKQLANTKVVPAIYNYQPAGVLFYGTVVFSIAEAKPRVRIYLHQDPEELKKESDFIGPQPVLGGESKFRGLQMPQAEQPVAVSGIVDLLVKVDAQGKPSVITVVEEEPPLLGFGQAALTDFEGVRFIPAFRDGDPTACETVLPVFYPTE